MDERKWNGGRMSSQLSFPGTVAINMEDIIFFYFLKH